MAAARSDAPTRLLYSSRSREDAIYAEELDHLSAEDGTLEVTHTLTRSQSPGWTGYSRRIDREMLEEVGWPSEERPLVCLRPDTAGRGGGDGARRTRITPHA